MNDWIEKHGYLLFIILIGVVIALCVLVVVFDTPISAALTGSGICKTGIDCLNLRFK